jgi:hypothetical protein
LLDVATGIELEASDQMWRAQPERYWFLSRRAWFDYDTLQEIGSIESAIDVAVSTSKTWAS